MHSPVRAVGAALVLAGAGVLLSTLHQSSLGTVYLIVPGRLHPYWYTPLLPLLFLVSAVKCGLAMAILEASLSHERLGAAYEADVVRRLGRGLLALVGVTLALQVGDLVARDVVVAPSTYEGRLLLLEVALGGLLPLAVLLGPRGETPPRLLLAAVTSVLGVLLHRMNVAVTGHEGALGGAYVPHPAEALVTLGLVSAGVTAFAFLARYTGIARPDYRRTVALADRLSIATLAGVAGVAALALAVERGPDPATARPAEGRHPLPDAARLAPDLVLAWAVPTSFPHAAHPFACPDCHADSWPVLAGTPPAERRGHGADGCASCHDGRRAFGVEAEAHCDRCHAPYVHFDPAGPPCASCHDDGPAPGRTVARALFPHDLHAARTSDCRSCHADGRDRPPWGGVTMADLRAGAACGVCHDGRRAFALEDCGGCHGR